jgi:hypothetical protein
MISQARVLEAVRCQIAEAFAAENPDPAGMIGWKLLATVSIDGASGYETHPGLGRSSGKSGNLSWSATTAGMNVTDDTTVHTGGEIKTNDIPTLIGLAPCGSDTVIGLPLAERLRAAKAGQPGANSGADPGKVTFRKVYKIEATAGTGFSLTFSEYKASFEGNKADASNTYTIDVRLGPQTGGQAPFMSIVGAEFFGLNAAGQFDDFSDLRADRDKEDEEEDTVIKVPPGVPITIGSP